METTKKAKTHPDRFRYLNKMVIQPRLNTLPPALTELIDVTARHPKERFASSVDQLLLYQSLTFMMNAKKILDCGTLTGLSAFSFALGCGDDGHVYTIDVNEEFVSIGKKYWEKAGISNKITSILRSAVDVTKEMLKEHEGTFDIAYLDVPKEYYEVVYENLVPLLRPKGLLLVDNIFLDYLVFEEDESKHDELTTHVSNFNKRISSDDRMLNNFIDIGDGLAIAVKK
ncbi:catechol O-methyltransferase domain-containing protein 1-like [Convolutriloba macropyga]|uniref:catechol O-methyltransferase domain-containing protein 1-like n=1 Tax=Convolutriloba macropyga TaxID=536237 RepID=UPI003F52423A